MEMEIQMENHSVSTHLAQVESKTLEVDSDGEKKLHHHLATLSLGGGIYVYRLAHLSADLIVHIASFLRQPDVAFWAECDRLSERRLSLSFTDGLRTASMGLSRLEELSVRCGTESLALQLFRRAGAVKRAVVRGAFPITYRVAPHLRELVLSDICGVAPSDVLLALAAHCTQLVALSLTNVVQYQLPRFRLLHLGLRRHPERLWPNLTFLDIGALYLDRQEECYFLARCAHVRHLAYRGQRPILIEQSMPSLRRLDLRRSKVNVDFSLKGCTQLEWLDASNKEKKEKNATTSHHKISIFHTQKKQHVMLSW